MIDHTTNRLTAEDYARIDAIAALVRRHLAGPST